MRGMRGMRGLMPRACVSWVVHRDTPVTAAPSAASCIPAHTSVYRRVHLICIPPRKPPMYTAVYSRIARHKRGWITQ